MESVKSITVYKNRLEVRGFSEDEVGKRYSVTIDGDNIILRPHPEGFMMHLKNAGSKQYSLQVSRNLKAMPLNGTAVNCVYAGNAYLIEAPAGTFYYKKPITFTRLRPGKKSHKNNQTVSYRKKDYFVTKAEVVYVKDRTHLYASVVLSALCGFLLFLVLT